MLYSRLYLFDKAFLRDFEVLTSSRIRPNTNFWTSIILVSALKYLDNVDIPKKRLANSSSLNLFYFSGITDSILFFIHYLLRKGRLVQWYAQTDLRVICRYGIVVSTIGLLSLGYFTTIQIMYKKPMLPIPDSSVIAIVWSLVALRSGLFLMYYSICYQRTDDTRLLTEEDQNNITAEEESSPITASISASIENDQP
ncbi:hypothetical protein NQ314_018809 [Rhamnusium bicolor]|uniref:Uncharacterized protein n=1 Tax=Rhamnusium bicolor TaxID=1586634 RepID=A0AAV8WR06_9CUCU|nr:hypothetical protein NQ314_018809 [Rhamnusium bicolor]